MYLIYYVYIIEILYITISYILYTYLLKLWYIYIYYIIILYTNLHNLHQIHTKKRHPWIFPKKNRIPNTPKKRLIDPKTHRRQRLWLHSSPKRQGVSNFRNGSWNPTDWCINWWFKAPNCWCWEGTPLGRLNAWFTYRTHKKKGTWSETWSEPNLQGIEFQPLIFRGVPKTSTNYIKWLAISWMMNVRIQWIGIQHPFMFHGQLSCFMIWYQIHPQRLSVGWWFSIMKHEFHGSTLKSVT